MVKAWLSRLMFYANKDLLTTCKLCFEVCSLRRQSVYFVTLLFMVNFWPLLIFILLFKNLVTVKTIKFARQMLNARDSRTVSRTGLIFECDTPKTPSKVVARLYIMQSSVGTEELCFTSSTRIGFKMQQKNYCFNYSTFIMLNFIMKLWALTQIR